MKWYDEIIQCKQQPQNVKMRLIGKSEKDGKRMDVTIMLEITEDELIELNDEKISEIGIGKHHEVTYYNGGITSLREENPTFDEILERYQHKISRIRTIIEDKTYLQIFPQRKYFGKVNR